MSWEAILAFNLALLAAWVVPGPAMLVAMRETFRGGRRAGIAAGIGLAIVSSTWTLAALLGLDILFTLFPWAYTALRIVGAAYLLWVAVQTWRAARQPIDLTPGVTGRAFRAGLLVNLGNPKSILFAAAVLVVIFPPDLPLWAALAVAANHFVLEMLLYAGLALALSTPRAARSYFSAKLAVDRIAATLLGALGLRLILDRS
ncbi:MAG: LysE family transporter [Pseudomonadota bacterium]